MTFDYLDFCIGFGVVVGLCFIPEFLHRPAKRKKKAKSSDFDRLLEVYLNLSSRIHTLYDAERRLQLSVNVLNMDVKLLQDQIDALNLRLNQMGAAAPSALLSQVEGVGPSAPEQVGMPPPDFTVVPPSLRRLEMD